MIRVFAPLLLVPILQLTPVALAKSPSGPQRTWTECEEAAPSYLTDWRFEQWMDSCLDGGPLDAYEEW